MSRPLSRMATRFCMFSQCVTRADWAVVRAAAVVSGGNGAATMATSSMASSLVSAVVRSLAPVPILITQQRVPPLLKNPKTACARYWLPCWMSPKAWVNSVQLLTALGVSTATWV